ncbi:MAG: clostripain-related cysteine peptidase [Thermodesulfobacteriota bacterium]|nr:clostripain-related cysteine peptidase [Thermodesulfobacteriota bacterium]
MRKILSILFCVLAFGFFLPQYAGADWTFMVYLDADNNLESAGIDDFLEMASVGSDSNVNIVVQFDRISGYDTSYGNWTECHRFLVTSEMTPETANAVSDWGDGSGGREVNMADPQNLINFATWAMTNYPADNYALILWNHGGGWRDYNTADLPIYKAVCWDDTSGGDSLYMSEVKSALTSIDHVNLVGFDACLMGMIEVAYEIKDLASVMVASQETEPGDGWPYDTLLVDLAADPGMDAASLGAAIVTRYGEDYGSNSDTTQSAVDLIAVDALASTVDALAVAMMDSSKSEIAAARASSQEYAYPEHIDLYNFAELLSGGSSNTDVQTACANVMTAVQSAVIANFNGNLSPDSYGVAIYFPETIGSFDSDYNDSIIDFPAGTEWDEFLSWYYSSGGDGITLLNPTDGAVLSGSSLPTFSWEAGPDYAFKILFSTMPFFPKGFSTFEMPGYTMMTGNSTDFIPVNYWQIAWNIIKINEQAGGIIYWRVVGINGPGGSIEASEIRSFSIE